MNDSNLMRILDLVESNSGWAVMDSLKCPNQQAMEFDVALVLTEVKGTVSTWQRYELYKVAL